MLQSYPMSTHSILPRGCTFSRGLNDSVSSSSSDRDLLELKKLKVHLLCPRNHKNCNIVPVGILPLLPSSNPPSPASSVAPALPHLDSPTNPSCTDDVCNNHHVHPTPPASSSDEDHSDSHSSPLVFRSSLDKTDPADPASPSTPTRKRSLSPLRTRKVAQHTSPSQPLARDVPAASERLAALCAPIVNNTLALSSFQMGSSTHRSASGVEYDSDSDHDRDRHHHHHHQYALSKRDARKPPNQDEQIGGGDADEDADADADADASADASDDEVAVVPPPFAPPPCLFIQPSAALTSQTITSFSLAQPVPSARPTLAPPKMPLLPFMPLLPTPREHSSSTGPQSSD